MFIHNFMLSCMYYVYNVSLIVEILVGTASNSIKL